MLSDIQNLQGPAMTFKQGQMLYSLTGLKFWQPERLPVPSIKQASLLIDELLKYCKGDKSNSAELLKALQIWFPGLESLACVHYRKFGAKKVDERPQCEPKESKPESNVPQTLPEQKESEPEQEQESKPDKKAKVETKKESQTTSFINPDLLALINAGLKNIWLVGPAGCGKTTICQLVGESLNLPVTIISCGAGTSATTFLGYKYPERESTPFVSALSQPGIIVLDEFTALEAQVAQVVNSVLANNEINATTGTVTRHEDCIIIATSNTFGNGSDRLYVSNNQLDASTIDRFSGAILEIDYSKEYESQYNSEVVDYCNHLRNVIKINGLRKIISTRSIINGCKLLAAGLNWKQMLIQNWSTDEKNLI